MSEQTLRLQTISDSKPAVDALNNLVSALGRIKNAVKSGMDFSKVSDGLGKLNQALSQGIPEENVARLERVAAVIDKLSSAKDVNIKVDTSKLFQGSVQDAQKSAEELSGRVKDTMAEAVSYNSNVAESADEIASRYVDATSKVELLQMKMSALRSELVEGIGNGKFDTKKIIAYTTQIQNLQEQIKKLNGELKDTTEPARDAGNGFSKLISSIGRVAFYRAIRTAIKGVTDGLKEGVTNVRKYSEAIGGSFARDMNTAAASLSTMRNSLGAAVAPALQALIPILSTITSFAITAFNALNQLLSLLRGGGSWTRATASMNNYTKAAKGAGGATKDLLADWDELNIIQSQGGGGGGGSDIDYSDMFEEVYEFDERIKAIVTWLQEHMDLVKAAAWGLVGAFAAWKLTDGFKLDILTLGKQIGRFMLMWLGVTVAIYGAKKAFDAFKDQFDNGINWDNLKKAIGYSALAVLGLGIAFGKLGIGYGLLGFGIALAINPIKELVETGQMSEVSMTQLAVAIGSVAGGLTLLVTKDGLKAARMMIGLGIAAYGAAGAYKAFREQWENGIDYENSTELIRKLGLAVLGLGIAFGIKGAGIGALAAGITEVITPIKEMVEEITNGKDAISALRDISSEAFAQLETGIITVGLGLSLLTGSWIPLAIAGVVDIVLWAVREWDSIVDAFKKAWENIGNWFYDNVTMPVGNFFIDMINKVLEAINSVISFINDTFGTTYALNDMIPRLEARADETAELVEKATGRKDPQRKKNITGTATEDQMKGYEDSVQGLNQINKEAIQNQKEFSEQLREAVGEFNLNDYSNVEEAINAINQRLEDNADNIKKTTGQTSELIAQTEEYTSAVQEAIDAVTEWQQTEFAKKAAQDQEAYIYATENALRHNLAEIEDYFGANPFADLESLFESGIKNNVIPMLERAGYDVNGSTAQGIMKYFHDKWIESLTSEDWEGDINGLMRLLKEAIEDPSNAVEIPSLMEDTVIPVEQEYDVTPTIDFEQPEALNGENPVQEALDQYPDAAFATIDDSGMVAGLSQSLASVQSTVASIRSAIMSLNGIGFSFGWSGFGGRFSTVGAAAEGGLFNTGEMFIAREAGPELVGRMGNRNAVANNDQIVSGIAYGVATANDEQNSLLRQQNALLTRLLGKKFTAEVHPSAALGRVTTQSQRMYERTTG